MLNSPTADQSNCCDLFSAPELKSLSSKPPSLMAKLEQSNSTISTIDAFLHAYAKVTPEQMQSLISIAEVK